MQVTLMKGKIHRAHVTEADLHYEGSISIDRDLIEAAGLLINERVDIYNIDNGARFSTYVIEAPAGSGTIGLNGAAARQVMVGDKVIIVAYANFDGFLTHNRMIAGVTVMLIRSLAQPTPRQKKSICSALSCKILLLSSAARLIVLTR